MALNDKKTGFGFDMDEKFKKVTGKNEDETGKGNSKTQTSDKNPPEAKQEHVHDYTHTHTYDDVLEPKQQERKQKRVQILTYESLVARMDKYAAKRGVSRAAVFEAAMIAFLDKVDPIEKK